MSNYLYPRGLAPIAALLFVAGLVVVAAMFVIIVDRTPGTAPTTPTVNRGVTQNVNTVVNYFVNLNTNTTANINPPELTPEEDAQVGPPAGWKTYTSTRYQVTFDYPPDMTVSENDQFLSGVKADNTKHFDLSILDRALDPKNVQGIYGKQDTTTVRVGSQDGYQYIEGDAGCGGITIQRKRTSTTTLKIYFGQCSGKPKNEFETDASLRERFLSTFQFTDQTAVTKDWKKYTNEEYGVSLDYPRDWVQETFSPPYATLAFFKKIGVSTYPDSNQPNKDDFVVLTRRQNPENLPLQQIFDREYKNCIEQAKKIPNELGCPPATDSTNWRSIRVGGVEALRSGEIPVPEGRPVDAVYVRRDGYYLILELHLWNRTQDEEYTAIFDRMLSTLNFSK